MIRRAALFGLLAACSPADPDLALEATLSPIVGGARERGFPAVGAMTHKVGDRYNGPFCTGTLIAPTWVLTAAHCTETLRAQGQRVEPATIFFYVGDDARGQRGNADPAAGRLLPTRGIHVHPQWRPDAAVGLYDLALVELLEPAERVTPYTLRAEPVGILRNQALDYVGFGVDDGVERRGSGVKRRTALRVAEVAPTLYVSAHDESGVCYGDSGGPGLRALEAEGAFEVVGVNSAVLGDSACLAASVQIRVDAHLTWARRIMGEDPACGADPEAICGCAAACRDDGSCDVLRCGGQTGCRELVECTNGCRGGLTCFATCYGAGAEDARLRYDAVRACAAERCAGERDVNACVQARCPGILAACMEDLPPGQGDCPDLIACSNGCRGDRACALDCYADADLAARRAYDGLSRCVVAACGDLREDAAAYGRCVNTECVDAWQLCDPPDGCDVRGGDCPPGAACVPAPWGGTYCRESGDAAVGAVCDPLRLSCGDGAFCRDVGAGDRPRCQPVCVDPADCEPGQACGLIEQAAEPFGTCEGCRDADGDGTCAAEDCDDGDPARPSAEICGDGIDQDCDDAVDEGCDADMGPAVDAGAADAGAADLGAADAGGPDQGRLDGEAPPPDAGEIDSWVDSTVDAAAVGAEPDPQDVTRRPRDGGCRATPAADSIWGVALLLLGVGIRLRRSGR